MRNGSALPHIATVEHDAKEANVRWLQKVEEEELFHRRVWLRQSLTAHLKKKKEEENKKLQFSIL